MRIHTLFVDKPPLYCGANASLFRATTLPTDPYGVDPGGRPPQPATRHNTKTSAPLQAENDQQIYKDRNFTVS
jgi:hypothetical protein